jgi:hypothetical protein
MLLVGASPPTLAPNIRIVSPAEYAVPAFAIVTT